MKQILHSIILCMSFCMLLSCSSRALHDAQSIVVEADSLWKDGQMYIDSAQLAQAYNELCYWQWMYPDEYAHACYHYGRLLRQKEDPVAAMQAFINATHSRTRDYHFLGRVYNNIGDMCHRAGEYALSYDMFEQSANMFLRDGDTLSYYYCLNDMALEMAEQGKRDSCFALLKHIYNSHTSDNILLAYCLHSQAQAYIICSQFDSAIVYANLSRQYIPCLSATLLQLAQAYSFFGEKDSAAFYAHQVLSMTEELYEINNALYILTNDDATKDMQSVRQTAADRSDTQKMIENHKYKLSQAVQLLEQDLTHKQSWIWLYIVVASFLIMGSIIEIYIYKKRKKHQLLSQKIKDLETTETQTLAQMRNKIDERCTLLKSSPHITKDLSWKDFEQVCQSIDRQFYLLASKLQNIKGLNETETRLCILVLIGLNEKEISQTLPYALSSIGKLKYRTSKKLGISAKNLRENIISIAMGDTIK